MNENIFSLNVVYKLMSDALASYAVVFSKKAVFHMSDIYIFYLALIHTCMNSVYINPNKNISFVEPVYWLFSVHLAM